MGQNVYRVCDENQDGIRANWSHSIEDLLEHLGVSTDQIQSGVARFLLSAGSDNDDIALASVLVMTLFDSNVGQEFCVRKILHLGVTDSWIDID